MIMASNHSAYLSSGQLSELPQKCKHHVPCKDVFGNPIIRCNITVCNTIISTDAFSYYLSFFILCINILWDNYGPKRKVIGCISAASKVDTVKEYTYLIFYFLD